MADDYITGHRPTETFQELVSRVNANSFFLKDDSPKPPKRKRTKVSKAIEALSESERDLLVLLLTGKAIRIQIGGEPYVAVRMADGWRVQKNMPNSDQHTVALDLSACSCRDCRMRGHECKHMVALKEVLS